jgi:Ohr subfamily peroxiredoxin
MTAAKILYTAKVHATGGRDGTGRDSEGRLNIQLSNPDAAGNSTNPGQLIAAGWSACFLGAMTIAAARMKVVLAAAMAVDAEVDLGLTDANYFLRARLNVSLPGIEREVAMKIVEAAHQICPYSKATRGNIDVLVELV